MVKLTSEEKTIAILLALFLGGLGAHRFYLGKTGTAILMIFLSISIIGIPVSAIWALVDVFLIATDKLKKE
jgi:TM2 domain-containing membrane protein YozV